MINDTFKLTNEENPIDYKELMLKITDQIKNGVLTEDGTRRPFQILDYYILTDVKPELLVKLSDAIHILPLEDYKQMRTFLGRYPLRQKMNVESNINGSLTIVEKDSQGIEQYRSATQEQKLETLDWMLNNDIGFYDILYFQALRRHMEGNLIKKEIFGFADMGAEIVDFIK